MRSVNWENRGDRWRRRDKHKVLARRRRWRGLLLNYVMEHVRGLNCRALIVCYAPRRASATSPRLTSTAYYLPVVSVISCANEEWFWIINYLRCRVAFYGNEHQFFLLFFSFSYSSAHINYSGIKKEDQRERGAMVWRIWLKRPGQQSCHVNRFIWIM